MPVKSNFASGDILTASNVNTYLTNGGLVYITEATASGSATTLSINNCFSSTYNNYRILIDYFQPATALRALNMRLRVGGVDATGTDYFYALSGVYVDNTATNTVSGGAGANVCSTGLYNSTNTIAIGSSSIDVFAPFRAERTMMTISATMYNAQFGARNGISEHNLQTSYDGFMLLLDSTGNITNLRVKVYGYRQA